VTRGILEVTVRCPFSLMWRQWAHKLLNAEFWDFLRQWQPWYTKAPAKGDQEPASNSCMRPVQRTNEERNWIQPAGEQDGPSLYPIRAPRPAARQGKNSGRSTCGLYIATCNNLASEAPGVWIVEGRSRCPHGAPCRLPRQPTAIAAAALDAVARLIVIRQRSPCSDIYSAQGGGVQRWACLSVYLSVHVREHISPGTTLWVKKNKKPQSCP